MSQQPLGPAEVPPVFRPHRVLVGGVSACGPGRGRRLRGAQAISADMHGAGPAPVGSGTKRAGGEWLLEYRRQLRLHGDPGRHREQRSSSFRRAARHPTGMSRAIRRSLPATVGQTSPGPAATASAVSEPGRRVSCVMGGPLAARSNSSLESEERKR
jgi:hypothetical protein